MTSISTLDLDGQPVQAQDGKVETRPSVESFGPSDISDTGSDTVGAGLPRAVLDADSDAGQTGESGAAGAPVVVGQDVGFDRVVGGVEAGLGGLPDVAEEMPPRLTDEELEALGVSSQPDRVAGLGDPPTE
jgi:hypothetical protein